MQSRWSDEDAARAVAHYATRGVAEPLALRTYSARLLGADPALVLHGGGNTSVKTTARDVYGDTVSVLCVKGSGWDLASIEPPGHPAVRLDPLRRLRALPALSDEDMVSVQRANLLDAHAPNPSVETLLHAYIPHTFVDHTHSTAVISLVDQPNAEAICRQVYGDRVACVPYIMPGFALARAAADVFDAHPRVEGLMLLKHGIFSFGATARESYERMIALVTIAEHHIARAVSRTWVSIKLPADLAPASAFLPALRGALYRAAAAGAHPRRWVFDHRDGERVRAFADGEGLRDYAARGPVTPDHVIRMKAAPLVLEPPVATDLRAWTQAAEQALASYIQEYETYFARQNARVGNIKTPLDPLPRVIAIPGIGLFGLGRDGAEARVVADLAEAWVSSIVDAEAIGRYEPIGENDIFDMEYWSLEQAKLGKAIERRLARHVVVITGGAGAIGAATARAFAAEGAEVALLDLDADAARRAAASVGRALGLGCDVTQADSVGAAFARIVERFGGVDIVVSNAGAAWTGAIATLPEEILRRSFSLNFFAHQHVAQAAVAVMRAQGMGGALLFNVSKQAVSPGRDFGSYGTAKAALLALVRQYALEHGADGIRANAVNPDRIRSGLLTDTMIASRATSRGVSEAEYMAGNLLGEEVTAEDVAQAFVAHALLRKTTGDVTTVDGGNVAAMLR